jgi:hypothetical protein
MIAPLRLGLLWFLPNQVVRVDYLWIQPAFFLLWQC